MRFRLGRIGIGTLEYSHLACRQTLTLMNLRHLMLIGLVVLLGGGSLYLNRDRFGADGIQISHRSRPARPGEGRSAVEPLFFAFDRTLKLTALKVIPVREIETNRYPQPIWHLVSDSNSVPIGDITYGVEIPGMRPAVKGATCDPLKPGVSYRLLIEAGNLKAGHDFVPVVRR